MVLYSAYAYVRRCMDSIERGRLTQSFPAHRAFSLWTRYKWLCMAGVIILTSTVLVSCAGGNANAGLAGTTASTTSALTRLHWCDRPLMVFRDLAASGTPGVSVGNPATITDWAQVKSQLGFSVYLPITLPTGSCLVSTSGTVRDPILGSNFVIGYVLPDHSSLTLSQAPQRSQSATFQCSAAASTNAGSTKGGTPTSSDAQNPTQFCSGVRGSTNIVFSSRGKTDTLQQFFNALQPDIDWIPAK